MKTATITVATIPITPRNAVIRRRLLEAEAKLNEEANPAVRFACMHYDEQTVFTMRYKKGDINSLRVFMHQLVATALVKSIIGKSWEKVSTFWESDAPTTAGV